jgi:putative GTP pyrophosphokinase
VKPDQFGYESVHYVLRLGENRAKLPEWKQFRGLRAEVQVRTALQHAWAAIDHKLRYKRARSEALPPSLQRDLFRLSALLELADKEFSALRKATADAQEAYLGRVGGGEFDIPLDALSLDAYLDSSRVDVQWAERALERGFAELAASDEEEMRQADRAYLLAVARHVGFETVADLDTVLREAAEDWGDRALDVYLQYRRNQRDDLTPLAWPADLLTILIMLKFGIGSGDVPDPQYEGDEDQHHWGPASVAGLNEAVEAFAKGFE